MTRRSEPAGRVDYIEAHLLEIDISHVKWLIWHARQQAAEIEALRASLQLMMSVRRGYKADGEEL